MKQVIIIFIVILTSCSQGRQTRFELTKEEAKNSYAYPIGMKIEFSESFEEVPVSSDEVRSMWIVLKSANTEFTVSALTDTNFSVPINKYLFNEANALLELDSTTQIIGTTNERFGKYKIPFIHLSTCNSLILDNCNGFSLGVLEFKRRQLQIHINEQLESNGSTADYLNGDIRTILNSIELE